MVRVRPRFLLLTTAAVLLLCTTTSSAAAVEHRTSALPSPERLKPLLRNISDWIVAATDLPSNNITNARDSLRTSIFINGNLARTLVAAGRIFKNSTYLHTGLAWCDKLVQLQHHQSTHKGDGTGGWWDTGYSELYIADTGTAVTALALCYDNSLTTTRKSAYLKAMLEFAQFVVNGTKTCPKCTFTPNCAYDDAGNNSETADTWLVGDGSLGDGYYKGALNKESYTIATATTGGAFFAEMHAITARQDFAKMASAAARWLIERVQANGTIPYIITPPTSVVHDYQDTSYSTEAIVDVDMRGLMDPAVGLQPAALRMVEYLLKNQQPSGQLIDPKTASLGEQQRSPRAISLLQWFYTKYGDERAARAVNAYVSFLESSAAFDPVRYGVNSYALVTGFVGLALADLIDPWCTFVHGLTAMTHS